MNDQAKLDDAKQRYLTAKQEIADFRMKLAVAACPLHIGDRVTIVDDNKEYEGRIDHIHYALQGEFLEPVPGAMTGWAVSGPRYKKGTDELSKWSFGFSSFDTALNAAKWTKLNLTLEEILGLPPMPIR